MREEIAKVLNDESIATNEEKLDAITKSLATLVIPKDTYNDLNEKYKKAENEKATLTKEIDDFRKSAMTEEERNKAEKEDLEKTKKELIIKSNELEVMRTLEKAGLKEEDYKDDLSLIVSEDTDKSLKLANMLVSKLQNNAEKVKKETVTDLLNNTPKPVTGNPDASKLTNLDAYKAKLDEAIKNKDLIAQATYTRLVQQEEQKLKK